MQRAYLHCINCVWYTLFQINNLCLNKFNYFHQSIIESKYVSITLSKS